ncbi:hypothetical protein KP509_02G105000 [Ceratopteris richardii]|uniref:YbhB/YbcL family Raf kinase inhibitor-like protein n=1 Tax=Ceratopteris richardii TaxID=49495 RepID=A0A8T2VDC5_CERRI|nr:hypothetical protein KP509_02G105000 [Ceratopteris richardii]
MAQHVDYAHSPVLHKGHYHPLSEVQEFRLVSSAFHPDGRIPRKFTQEGQGSQRDESPPLEWYGVPDGTESLALIMQDPDAPDPNAPIVPWVHWVLTNIPPTLKGIPANFTTKDMDPKNEYAEIQEGVNDWKLPGYRGPNPPVGVHCYEFRLYALDCKLKLGHKATKDKVLDAIEGHVLGEALLIGHYGKDNFRRGRDSYVAPSLPSASGPGTPFVGK